MRNKLVALLAILIAGASSLALAKGGYTFFIVDMNADDVYELFGVSVPFTPATRLNRTPVTNGDVKDFRTNKSGSTLVFRGDLETNDTDELWLATLLVQGADQKLNTPLVANGDVSDDYVVAGKGVVVYRADYQVDNQVELRSVDLKTRLNITLNGPMVTDGDVLNFLVNPQGTKVLYLADEDTDSVEELYLADTHTGFIRKLNSNFDNDVNGDVTQYGFNTNGTHAFYIADHYVDEKFVLWDVDLKTYEVRHVTLPLADDNRDVTDWGPGTHGQ